MYRITARTSRANATPPPPSGGRRRRGLIGVTVAALALAGVGLVNATSASAASGSVTDASFAWGVSGEQGGGAFAGGCNFLSAGAAGSTGSSRPWTEADGFYATQSGNVTVEKPNAGGTYTQPSWATKCQDANGAAVNPGSPASLSRNRVVFSHGTGTVDPAANTASISWTGSFTSVFYGGYTYWSATNPTLTVAADGSATLTATATGYGADMTDPDVWSPLTPTTITLANLHGVTVTDTGFTLTPDFLGVAVTVPPTGTAQAAALPGNAAYWGSFPQSFVDFQDLTGQAAYWYTSGGSRDAAKPALPLSVAYTVASGPVQTAPAITTQPTAGSAPVGGSVSFTAAASGQPAPTVQWQLLSPGSSSWQNYPGATNTTFTLAIHAAGYNGSKVRAVFTNDAGSATTEEADLAVITTSADSETITATVPETGPAGAFSWTINGSSRALTMTEATNKGSYFQSTGDLLPITVTDTRPGGPTWSVSGQVSDFNGDALSGKYLGWTPSIVTAGAGATAGAAVTPGLTSGNGLTDASTLASATAGHAPGSAVIGAGLDLQIPAATPAGTYSATLTLTALS